jgi:diguanylate cyclase (GGDEF)-like protein/PAS domain S-box-containing protein
LDDPELWKNLVHPDDREKVLATLNQIAATGKPGLEEFRMLAASGALFWFRAEGTLVRDQAGRGQFIQGVLLDITDRKRADEALQASESRYRTLVENIDLGITLISSDHKIIMTNAGQGKIFKKSPADFVGKECFREFEKRPAVCEHCPGTRAMATGMPAEVETTGVLDDGSHVLARVRAFPIFGPQGEATGFIEVVEDITARRQVEEALAASEAKYRALIETTHTGFVIIDPQGKVLDANSEYLRLTGYNSLSEILGRSVEEWTAAADLQRNVAAVQECAETGSIRNLEIAYVQKNGETIPIEINATTIQDASGKKIMSLVRDITQRKQMVEALEESDQRFKDITENAVEWVWEVDSEGKFTYSSPVVEQLLGYKPEEVLGQHFYDLFLPDERQDLKDKAFAIYDVKKGFRDFINRNFHKNGAIVWISTSGVPVLDAAGNLLGYRGANIDITERRQAQEALENANIQLQALVHEAEERNSTAALLNDMSEMLQTCQTSEEACAAINHFVPKFFPNDAGALYLLRNSKNLLSSVTTWGDAPPSEELFPPDNCWAVRSGRLHWVDDPASALLCKHITAADPRAMGYLCVPLMAQSVSLGILHIRFLSCATWERKAAELAAKQRLAVAIAENLALALANLKLRETLQNQAIRDPLTGLYNRRYLEETMDREIHHSRRLKAPLGVVMLDLDHFQAFNDNFGHGAGDALLSALAHVITAGIRSEDIVCRYGGEEFLLVLPGASLETTRERAENVRQAVTALQVKYQGRFLKSTTISLGVAIFPDHGRTAEEVITAADAALYQAKQAGRDRVQIAVSSPAEASAP